ncbi:hypothetical protein MJH12_09835 [bacterium]|nr:hypothetical protein [bacterium]
MNQNILNLDPQKQNDYIEKLIKYSEIARRDGLLHLEDLIVHDVEFIKECLSMVVDGYDLEDLSIISNQRITSAIAYIDGQMNLLISGMIAVCGQKSEKMIDLTIKSHNYSNLAFSDESYLSCCELLKNWSESIEKIDQLKICLSVKLFCLYAQELFISDVNPGDLVLLLNQKKLSILKILKQTFDVILMGVLSIHSGDHPSMTQRKLDCIHTFQFSHIFQEEFAESGEIVEEGSIKNLSQPDSNDLLSKEEIDKLLKDEDSFSNDRVLMKKEFSVEFLLRNLDSLAIQKLLKELKREELLGSLAHEDSEVLDIIYQSMSQDAAQILKEEIEMNRFSLNNKSIESSQLRFIQLVFQFIEEGDIVLGLPKKL